MSKIDLPENTNFSTNLENEDFFFHSNQFKHTNIVPKLLDDLQQVVEDLLSKSSKLKNLTKILSSGATFKIPEYLQSSVIGNSFQFNVSKQISLSGLHIGAVDGGLVSGTLAGIDILGLKGVGVYFHYGSSKITKAKYFPGKHQDITILPVHKNFTSSDFELFSSLQRSILELKTGIQLLEEAPASLDYLLMDGSFQFKRMVTPNTELNILFGKYFAYLRKLISIAHTQNTKVLFVVKDSKTSFFMDLVSQLLPHIIPSFKELYTIDYRTIVQNLRDSNFMHYLLDTGYRSFIINRSHGSKEPIEVHNIPYSFYLKVVKNDLPLRIDMLIPPSVSTHALQFEIDEISKIIIALSDYNLNYSLPAPIVEADARAKINQEQFDLILEYIRNKTFNYNSIEGLKLRRSRSPFKF